MIRYFLRFPDTRTSFSSWSIYKVKDIKTFNKEKKFEVRPQIYLEITKKQYNNLYRKSFKKLANLKFRG